MNEDWVYEFRGIFTNPIVASVTGFIIKSDVIGLKATEIRQGQKTVLLPMVIEGVEKKLREVYGIDTVKILTIQTWRSEDKGKTFYPIIP